MISLMMTKNALQRILRSERLNSFAIIGLSRVGSMVRLNSFGWPRVSESVDRRGANLCSFVEPVEGDNGYCSRQMSKQ